MPEEVVVVVDGVLVRMPVGSTVSAAIMTAGVSSFRRSVSGEARGLLCGMGICFECRVTIDLQPHCRSCQTICQNGMDIRTCE
ncbi:MAG TPA: 2Fe-2S iron-sulfur cluster-binding protein [Pyrinomonadaceae bacterium]|jgi:sarcosine oxidase subunit alpha|nr:2Fe-2S iron-sulfur cluster-binding protein [Pyrinomonadaceae bacterium]